MCGLARVLTKEGLQNFFLNSSWEERHGENSKFFIGFMKEESVRVKNGCGKLLRAFFLCKGFHQRRMERSRRGCDEKGRGWGKRRCRWPMQGAAVFADQRGAVVCPRSLAHRRFLRGWWSWWAGVGSRPTSQSASSSCFFCSPPPL